MITNHILANELSKDHSYEARQTAVTNSPDAYRYFIYGNNLFNSRDYPTARNWYQRALAERNSSGAERYIDRYQSVRRDNSVPEATILTGVANIYPDAGILDQAEDHYRKALALEPEKPRWMNNLAYFLIANNRNIIEGLELADKALEMDPVNYIYLDTKGWGLFKQAKLGEAVEILEKAWNMRPVYNHELYIHLEEAKKSVRTAKT